MPPPTPPPWPEKGTAEYADRIRAMAEGRARAAAKRGRGRPPGTKNRPRQAPAGAPLYKEGAAPPSAGMIDIGEPSPAAMGGDPVKPVERKRQRREEFDTEDVCKHVGMVFAMLGSIPGHEHWHREPDEVALIGEPATRCLNRLDPELRARVRELSDPAALVIACCWVIGPSLVKEISDARYRGVRSEARKQNPGAYHQGQAGNGAGSTHPRDTATVSTGVAGPPPGSVGVPPFSN